MEGCEIAGYSNIKKIKEPLFCKEAKLHGAQALQPLKITNVQVWKKIKLQGSQTCYCAAKTKKLQGTQTFTGWSLRQQRVWQKIKLHDSQTFSLLFPLWRRAKLHGSQTSKISSENGTKLWKKSKIAWFSNMYHNIISIILGLEECEITWYSNTCYIFQPEHTWKRKKLQNSQTRM